MMTTTRPRPTTIPSSPLMEMKSRHPIWPPTTCSQPCDPRDEHCLRATSYETLHDKGKEAVDRLVNGSCVDLDQFEEEDREYNLVMLENADLLAPKGTDVPKTYREATKRADFISVGSRPARSKSTSSRRLVRRNLLTNHSVRRPYLANRFLTRSSIRMASGCQTAPTGLFAGTSRMVIILPMRSSRLCCIY